MALVTLFILAHTWRYPIPFLNDREINAGGRQFCLIFATKLVAMATSLKISEKKVRLIICHSISTICAKIVKIGPVDPEILRLLANESCTKQNWLSWQRPLRYWKKNLRSIIYTQKAFIWCKNCKNCTHVCVLHTTQNWLPWQRPLTNSKIQWNTNTNTSERVLYETKLVVMATFLELLNKEF